MLLPYGLSHSRWSNRRIRKGVFHSREKSGKCWGDLESKDCDKPSRHFLLTECRDAITGVSETNSSKDNGPCPICLTADSGGLEGKAPIVALVALNMN